MSAERPPVQPLPHLTLTYTSSNRRNTLLEVVLASSIASRPEQRLAWPFDVLWWYESIWNTCFEANYYYAPGCKTLQASREKLRVGPNIFSGNSRAVKRWFREIECQEAFETASAWATRRRKTTSCLSRRPYYSAQFSSLLSSSIKLCTWITLTATSAIFRVGKCYRPPSWAASTPSSPS